jgi:predicted permease
MQTILFGINAVLPLILLMLIGYLLKKYKIVNQNFIDVGNKLVFRIALPALLFYNIYMVKELSQINWSMMIFALIGIFIATIIGFIFTSVFIKDRIKKGTIIQGTLRANFAILGIPLAEAIGGEMAVANVALIALVAIPLMSSLSVIVLSYYGEDTPDKNVFKTIFLKVVKNPLIIAIFVGFSVLLLRSFVPLDSITALPVFTLESDLKFLFTPIKWVSQITSPLALIILGATFKFEHFNDLKKQIAFGTALRSILVPLVVLSLAVVLDRFVSFFKFDSNIYPALIALFASPQAVTNTTLVKELKGNENLSTQMIIATTILSILTIFIVVVIFKYLELI